MSSSSTPPDNLELDPVFLHSRREAVVIFFAWLVCFIWSVPFCYLTGYITNFDPETFSTTWGIPSWQFWGILVPWIVADIFTVWFCFCYMKDDDLGEDQEGADLAEEIAEMQTQQEEGNA